MTDEEQKKIFAKNLSHYVYISGKQQKEIAQELHFNQKTFNGWCNGLSMPTMGKVQVLADYFGINKTDLIDEKDGRKELKPDFFFTLSDGSKIFIEYMSPPKQKMAQRLLTYYFALNEIGQKKALDNLEDLSKIYTEKKPVKYDFAPPVHSMVAETSTSYLAAAHNDHLDEEGELDKVKSDLAKLKKPDGK